MCNKLLLRLFIIILPFNLFFSQQINATHISGADISYKWISGNTFELTLTLYRDCSGIAAPNSVLINYKSASCGYNLNVTLNRIAGTGLEITKPCDSTTTNCNGGSSPGIQKYEYTGMVTLPMQCPDWIFGYSICCRNCAITTLTYTPNNCSGVPATYVEATLNNATYPENSSPIFTNVPVSFFCIGQQFHYNHGVYDADGDSLVYSLIHPRSASGTNVVFSPGYSETNPISSTPPFTLHSNGDIIMYPTAMEVGVMAILVEEFRNGVKIGSVVRDMEVWTHICSNRLPTASGINGTNVFDITVCPGQTMSFTINSFDQDLAQTVSMDWNYSIPGGNFSTSAGSRPTGTFTWTPTFEQSRNQPYNFTVTVQDDNCPSNGFQSYSYNITVRSFDSDMNITNSNCSTPGTGTALITPAGTGPFQYAWSHNGATTSSVNNLLPGNYIVTVTDANGCILKDTAVIGISSTLNASVSTFNTPSCFGGSNGSITVAPSGSVGPYSYSWSPSGGNGETATGLPAGNYSVTVTDGLGCSFVFNTSLSQPAVLSASVTGSAIQCNGGSDGSATVIVSGGEAPFTYNWSNGNSSSTAGGLSAGDYSVTVTDVNGCTASSSVNISHPPSLSGSVLNSTNVSCFGGSNGAGEVTASGGTGPYSYDWFPNGDTTASASGLSPGNYSVTITDSRNCTAIVPLNISEPAILTASINSFGNLNCFNDSSGYANVTQSGGTPPYTYEWSPTGENTASVSGLDAGNYSVVVSDSKGCTATASITITQPPTFSLSAATTIDATCQGAASGSASVSTTGGTVPYTYQWLPSGGNLSTANNLQAGNYTVTATDANGCTSSQSITINQPAAISTTVSSTNTTCFGGSNGSVSANVSGGSGSYNYLWTPGNHSTATVTGLSAGKYYLTVSDSGGCIKNDSVEVTQPVGLTLVMSSTFSTCKKPNGSASVSVSGGNPGYTYLWTPGNMTTDSIGNVEAGVYEVLVTDVNGCTATGIETVSNVGAPDITVSAITHVTCYGGHDGSATISLTGGQAPFTYDWQPAGGTGATATGLSAGNYTVEVTGKHNCKSLAMVTILEPEIIIPTITVTPASCFGASDGSVSVHAIGGGGMFDYVWDNGVGNTPTASGLPAGNYTVNISDQFGCSTVSSASITQPSAIVLAMTTKDVSCHDGNDGSASITLNGGKPPYSVNWSVNGNTSLQLSGLQAGNYSVTVNDSSGCSIIGGAIINQPAKLTAQVASSIGSCGLPNATASVSMSGGIPPYTYLWNQSGKTTPTVSGLAAGNYNFTATDSNGCVLNEVINIINTGELAANVSSVTDVSCYGGSDGKATINITNGIQPFTFNWQPSGNTAAIATNLSAGNYNVVVTDGSNCTANVAISISEPPALVTDVVTTDIKCNGDANGSASAIVSGGTGVYTYKWLPGGSNASLIGSLNSGNYTLEVTDEKNCLSTKQFTITEPAPLAIISSSIQAGCNLSNGSASVTVSGGTAPYSYLWNQPGIQGPSITGIPAGAYSVTVSDINNCISTTSVAVSNTVGPTALLMASSPASCFGSQDGTAEIILSGGTGPFNVSWHPYGGSALTANTLGEGNYTITVRDINNCVSSIPVTITQPPAILSSITPSSPQCYGGSDGSALVNASGGIPPYTYLWSNGNTTPNATGLSKGSYNIKVTDATGCSSNFGVSISEPTKISLTLQSSPVLCHGRNDGFAAVNATGGTPGYSYLWSHGSIYSSGTNFHAGNYTVTVTDAHGCKKDTSLTITEPDTIIITTSWTDVSCRGMSNGQGAVIPTGGVEPFIFEWLPFGGHNDTASNLPAGLYDIIVTDNNGCQRKVNITIGAPAPLVFSRASTNVKCFGGSTGSASVTATGGTSPYSYFWSNGSTTSTVTGLPAGTYNIIVTDDHSCTATGIVAVAEPTPLNLTIQSSPPICNGQSATIAAIISGGTPAYVYTWSTGSQDSIITVTPNATTIYKINIRDANGCIIANVPDTVIVYPGLLALAIGPDTICQEEFATLMVLCSGGDGGPYNYTWDMGATTDVVTVAPLETTTYQVIVSDGCGTPPVSVNTQVFVRPNPKVNFFPNPVSGCQPLTVNFEDKSDMPGIEYYWNFGDGNSDTTINPSHIFLDAGSYTVNHLVKSEHGCVGKLVMPGAVTVHPLPIAGFTNSSESGTIFSPMVSFFEESTNTAQWIWDFGDNTGLVYERNPQHAFPDTGTFIVKLISVSGNGCVDTAFGQVVISQEFAIYIPNAFTPNNDGVNDYFTFLGMGIVEYDMWIFDRWGSNIFHSSDAKIGWNGKVQGTDNSCPMDVYVYKIHMTDIHGKTHNYVGRISLVR